MKRKNITVSELQDKSTTAVQRFDDWYLPYASAVLISWRERHPVKHHCEPLRADLHTNLPITVKEYDWF